MVSGRLTVALVLLLLLAADRPGLAQEAAEPIRRLRPGSEQVDALAARDGPARPADAILARARRGWQRYEQGDVESAREILAETAAHASAPAWAVYAHGLAAFATSRYEEAALAWERVRRLAEDFQPVYFDLTDAYLQLDILGRASSVLQAAERRWPDDADVLNALGVVHIRRHALDDALASFEKAASTDPDDAVTQFNLAKTHELRYERLHRWSQSARSWTPDSQDLRNAARHYRRCLELGGPLEAEARNGLARVAWAER